MRKLHELVAQTHQKCVYLSKEKRINGLRCKIVISEQAGRFVCEVDEPKKDLHVCSFTLHDLISEGLLESNEVPANDFEKAQASEKLFQRLIIGTDGRVALFSSLGYTYSRNTYLKTTEEFSHTATPVSFHAKGETSEERERRLRANALPINLHERYLK